MLCHVRMDVHLPHDMDPERRAELRAAEKARAEEIQRAGKWPELWRVAGEYANISIFEVESPDELHELLSSLPLFGYMTIQLTLLSTHPSKVS